MEMAMEKFGSNSPNEMWQEKKPCFYKIIWPGLTSEQLQIPPCFLKHIQNPMSDMATIRGPFGGCWNVKIIWTANKAYLQDGWKDFVEGHSFKKGDFLLFTYDGNLCFSIQIFGPSGLERVPETSRRQEAFHFNKKKKQVEQEANAIETYGAEKHHQTQPSCSKRKPDRHGKNIITISDESGNSEHEITTSSIKRKTCSLIKNNSKFQPSDTCKKEGAAFPTGRRKPRRPGTWSINNLIFHQSTSSKYSPVGNPHLQQFNEQKQSAMGKDVERKIRTAAKKGAIIKKPDAQAASLVGVKGLDSVPIEYEEGKHTIMEPRAEEEVKAWRKSFSFTSEFPFYRCFLEELHVKKRFIVPISKPNPGRNIQLDSQFSLCNTQGESWMVNIDPSSDGHSFSEGWKSFVLDNNLRQGDVCIFELVRADKAQVHVFRGSKKLKLKRLKARD